MDEPENTPAEEQETVEETGSTEENPWGEDFDAQRAWSTIQNLRGETKELKQQSQKARELEELFNNDDALVAHLRERGYEFDDLQDDDLYEDPSQEYQRALQAQEARLAQIEEENARRAFNADLDELASKEGLKLNQRDRRNIEADTLEYGANPDALKQAFEEFLEERKNYDKAVIDGYVKSKKNAPRSPGVGSEATERLDLDDRSERVKAMTEKLLQSRANS